MKLNQLLSPWTKDAIGDCEILGLQNDSRLVKEGDLFFAYPGKMFDGRLFINKALSQGAVACVYDPIDFSISLRPNIPMVAITDLAKYLAPIASRFYENPSQELDITGITGTNGKTTVAYLLAQAHHVLGQKSAYLGTIGHGEVHDLQPLNNTTPDGLCLFKLFDGYKNQGIKQVCMEVSSHALSQHRVDGVNFNQAIFTNLTLDHLDYHKTMQAYAEAKSLLFRTPKLSYAILNQDDSYSNTMAAVLQSSVKKITYGIHSGCDVQAVSWHMGVHGTDIEVHSPWGKHQLKTESLGLFNIYNTLAIFTSLLLHDYSPDEIVQTMAYLKSAPGRMEVVIKSPYVLVDFAHTPDALQKALSTLHELKKGRLWVLFGCGGDRDKTKRPLMGQAASQYADQLIITSDNPRTEDPDQIIGEIVQGIPAGIEFAKISDREEAIAYTLNRVEKNDILLIAGKGHEDYQIIGNVKHHFSDQEVVKRLMKVENPSPDP